MEPGQQLEAAIEPALRNMLAGMAQLAQQRGERLWLVGGVVRDLLLGIARNRDIDLALAGDAAGFARACAGRIQAIHEAFGTATVEVPHPAGGEPFVVDLAATRRERYPQPAALPDVAPAAIDVDLFRRDFSINAMALPLAPDSGGELHVGALLDPYGGQRDLAARQLCILHPASFDDDPTRILRGLRLAARLGLHCSADTMVAMQQALAENRPALAGPDRLRNEICLALAEAQPAAVLRLADAWQITPALAEGLRWSPQIDAGCRQAAAAGQGSELVYAGIFCYEMAEPERLKLRRYYRLPQAAERLLREIGPLQATLETLQRELPPGEVESRLRSFAEVSLRAAMFMANAEQRRWIEVYLDELRKVRPLLDGHALQQMGIPPGPEIGRILGQLRRARLDGTVVSWADEEQLVRRMR
jgi:tRNA nucleotidyltransferase (CCA-adding enzyme)